MLNLDTHILLFALRGELTPKEMRLLHRQAWGISAIVLWEIAKLTQMGRIYFDLENPVFARALSQLHIWPVDLFVCQEISRLDFNGDCADEIIAATSRVYQVPLLTRDKKLLGSTRIPLAGKKAD